MCRMLRNHGVFSHQKYQNSVWNWRQIDEEEVQRGCSDAVGDPRIFAMIAKISLGLRKFRNHSENFAILAKLRIFARLAKFR